MDAATPVSADMLQRHRVFLGTITPSSNTVVERVSLAILGDYPQCSAHFSRTPVVGASDPFPDRYDLDSLLGAGRLLAHAQLDALVWNGSKGATIGLEHDRDLCRRLEEATGIPATTAMLELDRCLQARGIQEIGLVTPYGEAYQRRTMATLAGAGYGCVAEAHAGLDDNFAYSRVAPRTIADLIRAVARHRPPAILCLCTNFPAAPVAPGLERELGIPVLDSVAAGVRGLIRLSGLDTGQARRWGSLFGDA